MVLDLVNVPRYLEWNDTLLEQLKLDLQDVLGPFAEISVITHHINDPDSKIHAMVSELPLDLNPVSKTAIAKHIFRFLELHMAAEGADVYLTGQSEDNYFDRASVN